MSAKLFWALLESAFFGGLIGFFVAPTGYELAAPIGGFILGPALLLIWDRYLGKEPPQ
jgi:hypothetical protein